MEGKTSASIGFKKQLWDAACVMWGISLAGLIFLRYISAVFDKQYTFSS